MEKGDQLELMAGDALKLGYKNFSDGRWCTAVKIVQATQWWKSG